MITVSQGLGRLIPKDEYPTFDIDLISSKFDEQEKIKINNIEKDLKVVRHQKSNFFFTFFEKKDIICREIAIIRFEILPILKYHQKPSYQYRVQ